MIGQVRPGCGGRGPHLRFSFCQLGGAGGQAMSMGLTVFVCVLKNDQALPLWVVLC